MRKNPSSKVMNKMKIILSALLTSLLATAGVVYALANRDIASVWKEHYFNNLTDKLILYHEYNGQRYNSYEGYVYYLRNQANLNNEDLFAVNNDGEIDLTDSILCFTKVGSRDNLSHRICDAFLGKFSPGYKMPILDLRDVESLRIRKLANMTTKIYCWSNGFFINDKIVTKQISSVISKELITHYTNIGLFEMNRVGLDSSIINDSEYIRVEYNRNAEVQTSVIQAFSKTPVEKGKILTLIAEIAEGIENEECLKSIEKCVIYLNVSVVID